MKTVLNHLEIEIDELAIRLLALQQPMAKVAHSFQISVDLDGGSDEAQVL